MPRRVSVALVVTVSLVQSTTLTQTTRGDDVLTTFRGEFVEITPGTGMFPGQFRLGSEHGEPVEQPVRTVRVTRPFQIGKYEIWQDLYQEVMGVNPSRWKGRRNSTERMTWTEANEFCRQATQLLREKKLIRENEVIRLPTEAEWEYCCRAGTETKYSFGNDAQQPGDAPPKATLLDVYAWHTGNAAGNDPAVGVLKPNPWGLYDIHGYLWEFTADRWTPSHEDANEDAHLAVRNESEQCVIRGGSWREPYQRLTSSARKPFSITARSDDVGFRCVLSQE